LLVPVALDLRQRSGYNAPGEENSRIMLQAKYGTVIKKHKWLVKRKRELIEKHGCFKCGTGKVPEGFEKFWSDFAPEPYRSALFSFRNPEGISVTKLRDQKGSTIAQLEAVLESSIILCRKCSAVDAGLTRLGKANPNPNVSVQERESP
jgi:hypothetical protein